LIPGGRPPEPVPNVAAVVVFAAVGIGVAVVVTAGAAIPVAMLVVAVVVVVVVVVVVDLALARVVSGSCGEEELGPVEADGQVREHGEERGLGTHLDGLHDAHVEAQGVHLGLLVRRGVERK
jgi:hypothetical protein